MMTLSAHKKETMAKSTVPRSTTSNNLVQPPDHSKTPDTSNATIDKVVVASEHKLQSNTTITRNHRKTMIQQCICSMKIQKMNPLYLLPPTPLRIHTTMTWGIAWSSMRQRSNLSKTHTLPPSLSNSAHHWSQETT